MDNQEASAILAQLNLGTPPSDPDGQLATACAATLHACCHREAFTPELPQFQLLCRLATTADPECSGPATHILYHQLIEPLCDDFTLAACRQAHAVLAGLLFFTATLPAGLAVRDQLAHLDLNNPATLLARWQFLSSPAGCPGPETLQKIETILIPSRISVGADVAITSVLAQRLAQALPGAEIILVGPDHLAELFCALPGMRHLPFPIERHGNLADRLLFWPQLLVAIATTLADRPAEKVLVVDSDSRLTQLGLLPLSSATRSCQFPSQCLPPRPGQGSLSALVNQWLDGWLGESAPCYPTVTPPADRQEAARSFCAKLREAGTRRLLLVNFGVGGDPRKSLPESFELALLTGLLSMENTIIILDMGSGSEEKVRAEKQLNFMAADDRETLLIQDWQLPTATVPFRHGVIGLCSALGTLAALGANVDAYLGYDSCGQHLANGAGTPAVTIFVGAPNPRFLERWSPLSPAGTSQVIPVSGRGAEPKETAAILFRILEAVRQLPRPR